MESLYCSGWHTVDSCSCGKFLTCLFGNVLAFQDLPLGTGTVLVFGSWEPSVIMRRYRSHPKSRAVMFGSEKYALFSQGQMFSFQLYSETDGSETCTLLIWYIIQGQRNSQWLLLLFLLWSPNSLFLWARKYCRTHLVFQCTVILLSAILLRLASCVICWAHHYYFLLTSSL